MSGSAFDTPDRAIVISGDAAPSPSIVDACSGCAVLMHEACSLTTHNTVALPCQAPQQAQLDCHAAGIRRFAAAYPP